MDRHAAHNRPILPMVLVVMGVSGSGKTTVGKLLADGWAGSTRKAMPCIRPRTSPR